MIAPVQGPPYEAQQMLLRIRDGELAPPPSAALLGVEIEEVSDGCAVFRLTPARQHLNPTGSVHGGFLATLADFALCSAVNTVPDGTVVSTLALQVSYQHPVTLATGTVRAVGRMLHLAGRTATAEASVVDLGGNLHAHAIATCHLRLPSAR